MRWAGAPSVSFLFRVNISRAVDGVSSFHSCYFCTIFLGTSLGALVKYQGSKPGMSKVRPAWLSKPDFLDQCAAGSGLSDEPDPLPNCTSAL